MGGEVKPCLRYYCSLEAGKGLSPLWGRASRSLYPQALRGSAGSAVELAISFLPGQDLVLAAFLGAALAGWGESYRWRWRLSGGAPLRPLSPHSPFSLPCRPQGTRGYSRFPPLSEARTGQTGHTSRNSCLNSSGFPSGTHSSRLDSRKSAARPSCRVSPGLLTG